MPAIRSYRYCECGQRRSDGYSDQLLRDHRLRCGRIDCRRCGGVPIDVPKAMKYDDPYDDPPLHIRIPAGQQTLDESMRCSISDSERGYSNGDIGRVEAQQVFMKSL